MPFTDIVDNIDLTNIECLNQQKSHHLQNAFSPNPDYLESDVDEQLSIFLTFERRCKIFSLSLCCLPPDQRPQTILLFKNSPNVIGFEEAGSNEPTQTLYLTANRYDEHGIATVNLRFVKFQDVTTLSICVMDNLGSVATTRIDNLKLNGETFGPPLSEKKVLKASGADATIHTEERDLPLEYASLDDLNKVIASIERITEGTSKNHPRSRNHLITLGNALLKRFESTGLIEDLNKSIVIMEQLIESTPPDQPDHVVLNDLGIALLGRFKERGLMEDLDRAILIKERAVKSVPVDHPSYAVMLSGFGNTLQTRYERTGSMDDLNDAIRTHEEAVKLTPINHPDRSMCLYNLGNSLQSRFERTKSMADIDRAIMTTEQAVKLTPIYHPKHAMCLDNLGNALQSRFERTGSMQDLKRAIELKKQAIKLTPIDHPNRAGCLNNLGTCLQRRFERTGSIDDLDGAIMMYEQSVKYTPTDHPDRTMHLNNLGSALRCRSERTGSMEDLNRAIKSTEQSVKSTPTDHPSYAMYLNNLGIALRSRFVRTESIEDLNRAITTIERSVELTPTDSPNRAMYLNNIGGLLHSRFERTGSMQDLDCAILTTEQAVKLTPIDHPDLAMHLNNLGNSLQSRFERTGSMADINRAIASNEQTLELTPIDHSKRAMYLNNLGNSLQCRFVRTGSIDDIDRACALNEQAVKLTPINHPAHATSLHNLGNALQSRFERTGSMQDLDHAIVIKEQAVQSTTFNHPGHASSLNSLGASLQRRFEHTESIDDLNRAIVVNEQSVKSTPTDHYSHAARLNNLGNALQSRFKKMGSMEDLDKAITTIEQAIKSTPIDHPSRAGRLNNLGNALHRRFERTGSVEDFDYAVSTKEQAANSTISAPSLRVKAAYSCSNLLISQGHYARARPILRDAVQLLPKISPRGLRLSDQQFNLAPLTSLTSLAVSLSLADTDEPFESLQLLELDRGILANLQLEVRSDISDLSASHPDLARQFQELRYQIDPPSGIFGDSLASFDSTSFRDPSKSISQRHALLKRFDNLLEDIRTLKGFGNFLRGPSESELRSLAEGGNALVVFNISKIRSDVILVTKDEIRSIHLPLLTWAKVVGFVERFIDAINERDPGQSRHAKHTFSGILEGLWDCAVKRVLDELGFTDMPRPNKTWPRVWWITSGLLSILPIHAAGYHNLNPPQTALDRVVSSYAYTIKSLSYAQKRATKAYEAGSTEKSILFAMPSTPEKASLRFVEKEVQDIEKLLKASMDTTVTLNPRRVEVLSQLPKYPIVHFACHGYSAEDPSQSTLFLEDWKTSPLIVSDLVSLNIEGAKFAYLSACHTSSIQDCRLLDESINLASAIQLCGYPSVIGSLWEISDEHSAAIAQDVYKWILQGKSRFDGRRSAYGLHQAIRDWRDRTIAKKRHDPLTWAPFIHIGI